jgi:hypothetical protein
MGGGAIWIRGVRHVRIEHCSFFSNAAAKGCGGAVLIHRAWSVRIVNSTFAENLSSNRELPKYAAQGFPPHYLQALLAAERAFEESRFAHEQQLRQAGRPVQAPLDVPHRGDGGAVAIFCFSELVNDACLTNLTVSGRFVCASWLRWRCFCLGS